MWFLTMQTTPPRQPEIAPTVCPESVNQTHELRLIISLTLHWMWGIWSSNASLSKVLWICCTISQVTSVLSLKKANVCVQPTTSQRLVKTHFPMLWFVLSLAAFSWFPALPQAWRIPLLHNSTCCGLQSKSNYVLLTAHTIATTSYV
jgi:hypothetical protein